MFYGISVKMYWNDHAPPHFHVDYGEYRTQYVIETLELMKGSLLRRAHVFPAPLAQRLCRRPPLDNHQGLQRSLPLHPVDSNGQGPSQLR